MTEEEPRETWQVIHAAMVAGGVDKLEASALLNEHRADAFDSLYNELVNKRYDCNPHRWVRFLMNVAWDKGIVTAMAVVSRLSEKHRAAARIFRNPRKVKARD